MAGMFIVAIDIFPGIVPRETHGKNTSAIRKFFANAGIRADLALAFCFQETKYSLLAGSSLGISHIFLTIRLTPLCAQKPQIGI